MNVLEMRQQGLYNWLTELFACPIENFEPMTNDASFRRYFRFYCQNQSYVAMDAPPEQESLQSFLYINQWLELQKIRVPHIYFCDEQKGFLVLEDLGQENFYSKLVGNFDFQEKDDLDLYHQAIAMICQFHHISVVDRPLPLFDEAHIRRELALFPEWFLGRHLNYELNIEEKTMLESVFSELVATLQSQPQVFTHLDFHSRNIMVLATSQKIASQYQELVTIDYQDAKLGPLTYDLVSLLKDCYVKWPRVVQLQLLQFFYEQTEKSYSFEELIKWFDFTGVQRHLKVLGIFCRLYYRDHKAGYLNDLPRVFNYVVEALKLYPEWNEFANWFQRLEDKMNLANSSSC